MRTLPWTLTIALGCAGLAAQKKDPKKPVEPQGQEATEDKATLQDLVAFTEWLTHYKDGAYRLQKDGKDDLEAIAKLDVVFGALGRWNSMVAVKKLFEAAIVDPVPAGMTSSMAKLDFHREVQPWKVRDAARRTIAGMQVPGMQEWLSAQLEIKARGGKEEEQDRMRRDAALRTLALLGGKTAEDALKKATQTLPAGERVMAIQTLGQAASLATLPHLLQLAGDVEPNARIAAVNAIARALGPLVDETKPEKPTAEAIAATGPVLEKFKTLLARDPVWQVRAAVGEACVALRCRAAIPVLIAGLEAELLRAKDPWAVDLRLHKLLEGMTGQKVAPGSANPWKDFWKREGAKFAFAANAEQKEAAKKQSDGRYQKFFNLEVDSRRVLFVLDFSGSMAEPANLKPKTEGGTGAKAVEIPGVSGITKAQLVVQELKKMVMSLPDGSLFNLIVFSDDVRIWRPDREGRPTLVKIDDQARDDLMGSFLDSLSPHGPTNLHGALDKALGLAGRGLYDKWYATSYDTLYVLSDGAPSFGEVTDKDEICRIVREANGLKKVVIHTVTFGDQNDTSFLKKMAEENGGRHIHVD